MNTSQLEEFVNWNVLVGPMRGDFNQDGHVDFVDLSAMLAALTDLNGYKSEHDFSNTDLVALGDFNSDGTLDNTDVQAFLYVLKSGGDSLTNVPEPALLALSAAGGLLLFCFWIGHQNEGS